MPAFLIPLALELLTGTKQGKELMRSTGSLLDKLLAAKLAKELQSESAGLDFSGWDVAGRGYATDDSAGWDAEAGLALPFTRQMSPMRGRPTSDRHAAALLHQLKSRGPMVPHPGGYHPGAQPFLPPGANLARTDRNPVSELPFEATDPTVLTLIPVTSVKAAAALVSVTFPPNLFFAADLVIDTFGGSFSVDLYTIGGVPVIQGNGSYSASLHAPGSFQNPPLRRVIETSQPIQLNITNQGTLASLVSAYIPGYLSRGVMSNY